MSNVTKIELDEEKTTTPTSDTPSQTKNGNSIETEGNKKDENTTTDNTNSNENINKENSTNEKSHDATNSNKTIDSSNNSTNNNISLHEPLQNASLGDSNPTLPPNQTSTWIYSILVITVGIILLLSCLVHRKSKRKQRRGGRSHADLDEWNRPGRYNEVDYQDVEMQDWSESDREGDTEGNEYLTVDTEGSNDYHNSMNFDVVLYKDESGDEESSENIGHVYDNN
ncbi:11610_t:CDS:2 [Ambispora gerdemannii]|uniref:11610_t:CDS:1 n=1 Tax=Ambispora gerdemannii TaxID=144530 RepID=A0A9N8VBB1_9GLOM|nr:11610_t:CDS:2 [Ambispora gerdemannii]